MSLQTITYKPPLSLAVRNNHFFIILSWILCFPGLPFKEVFTKMCIQTNHSVIPCSASYWRWSWQMKILCKKNCLSTSNQTLLASCLHCKITITIAVENSITQFLPIINKWGNYIFITWLKYPKSKTFRNAISKYPVHIFRIYSWIPIGYLFIPKVMLLLFSLHLLQYVTFPLLIYLNLEKICFRATVKK